MNPNPFQLAAMAVRHAHERGIREARQAALHTAAVARRRKAKRGGKR